MNYITEINRFERSNSADPLSAAAQLLWYRLMHQANKCGWPDTFSCSNAELMRTMQISEPTLRRCRDELIEKKLIGYVRGDGHKAGTYILFPPGESVNGINFVPGEKNVAKKEKNQKKEIYNNKYNYKYKQNTDTEKSDDPYDYEQIRRRALLKLNGKRECDVS